MIGATGAPARRTGLENVPTIVKGIVFLKTKINVVKLMNMVLKLLKRLAKKVNVYVS